MRNKLVYLYALEEEIEGTVLKLVYGTTMYRYITMKIGDLWHVLLQIFPIEQYEEKDALPVQLLTSYYSYDIAIEVMYGFAQSLAFKLLRKQRQTRRLWILPER